ncbi:hypothetical protein [Streptomyces sp. NPDC090445]|uniref:hypothetical protein n=1 Tax=Streptomyces sp. NPDC090445 TaxID=3365963 RepID=UPI00380CBA92
MDFKIREIRTAQGPKKLLRERETYFQLMQQGFSNEQACRIVGINSSLILSGRPGLVPSAPAADAQRVRERAAATNRHRQGANLPAVAGLLPALLEDLNTTILLHERGTAERDAALRLLVDAARNARQTQNQTGLPDLAWVAAEVAAGAATQLDDPIVKAAVAWDRCGALLHQGSARETHAVADAALQDLTPLSATGDTDALVLEGALVLRQVIACARAGDANGAWSQAARALEVSDRLPAGHHDLRWRTVFSRANVLVHTTEAGSRLMGRTPACRSWTRWMCPRCRAGSGSRTIGSTKRVRCTGWAARARQW